MRNFYDCRGRSGCADESSRSPPFSPARSGLGRGKLSGWADAPGLSDIGGCDKESSRRVVEGANLSEKVGDSLQAIVAAVERTANGIGLIADSTETQAASAAEVKIAIRSVSQTTESNAAAAGLSWRLGTGKRARRTIMQN